jgi:hypothetical protein
MSEFIIHDHEQLARPFDCPDCRKTLRILLISKDKDGFYAETGAMEKCPECDGLGKIITTHVTPTRSNKNGN